MVLALVFVGLGIVVSGALVLCWVCFWFWDRKMRDVAVLLNRPGLRSSEELRPLYILQDEYLEQEEAWHLRYHWCLLLAPIFFGLAAFCVVYVLTEDFHPWVHVPLTAVSAAGILLGCGYLGYGVVREKILPLEDGKCEEE